MHPCDHKATPPKPARNLDADLVRIRKLLTGRSMTLRLLRKLFNYLSDEDFRRLTSSGGFKDSCNRGWDPQRGMTVDVVLTYAPEAAIAAHQR